MRAFLAGMAVMSLGFAAACYPNAEWLPFLNVGGLLAAVSGLIYTWKALK